MPLRERWLVRGLVFVIFVSVAALIYNFYTGATVAVPQTGGKYIEGILGQPRFINPILAQTNDADRDLSQIIYSSLFKYDGRGNLIPDLTESYKISEDGLTYEISLKRNVLWHDQEPLNADDIIFTITTIQNPEYRSPLWNNWQGVKVEKIDEYTVSFKLNNVYAPFLHNLTVGIMPRHLWAGISAQNFALAEYNLKPIGSGPYQFKKLSQNKDGNIESIELVRNENFYLKEGPYIQKIIFKFYGKQSDLIRAYQKRDIDGISFLSPANQSKVRNGLKIYQIDMPVYYAIFFNQTASKALADKNVRLALAYATDKNKIIEKVLNRQAESVDSPLLFDAVENGQEIKVYDFNLEQAKNILEEAGWRDNDGDGIREKEINNEENKLEITLVTTDWNDFVKTGQMIKEQWEKIGARINLKTTDSVTVQQEYIRPRQYQALLFGEVLGADPDPFAFWHSTQRKDPGLNLALYQNKEADKLLEEARQTLDKEERRGKYEEFQDLVIEDAPAVFLYSPTYLYPVNKKVKGIEIEKLAQSSHRFSQIETWYIKTNRVWK